MELFAGVGGFALGLEGKLDGFDRDEGWQWDLDGGSWQVEWSNQWEPGTKRQHAAEVLRKRFEGTKVVDADIGAVLDHAFLDDGEALERHALEHRVRKSQDEGSRQFDAQQLAERWRQPLPEKFDLLVGGFPCQDYSVAKPLTQATGIVGDKGVLWWQIERIIRHRKPEHVLLENVDRLLKSPTGARGRDFAIMLATFAFHGYEVEWRMINAAHYGFPQRRRRVFIYARRTGERPGSISFEDFQADAERRLTSSGLMAEAFPAEFVEMKPAPVLLKGGSLIEPQDLTWKKYPQSPWKTAGYMRAGLTISAKVSRPNDREATPILGKSYTLGEMLLPVEHIMKDPKFHPFLVPADQLDDSDEPRKDSWNYLKGAKAEPRFKNGFSYRYTEGAVAFPEPTGIASRTILTSEGGAGLSRFKLVVEQDVPASLVPADVPDPVRDALLPGDGDGYRIFRRLTPIELERLNMFPDDWTDRISSDTRRAFTMGNALVVGIVERLGEVLAARLERS